MKRKASAQQAPAPVPMPDMTTACAGSPVEHGDVILARLTLAYTSLQAAQFDVRDWGSVNAAIDAVGATITRIRLSQGR